MEIAYADALDQFNPTPSLLRVVCNRPGVISGQANPLSFRELWLPERRENWP